MENGYIFGMNYHKNQENKVVMLIWLEMFQD